VLVDPVHHFDAEDDQLVFEIPQFFVKFLRLLAELSAQLPFSSSRTETSLSLKILKLLKFGIIQNFRGMKRFAVIHENILQNSFF
jgi:hypothetical protein